MVSTISVFKTTVLKSHFNLYKLHFTIYNVISLLSLISLLLFTILQYKIKCKIIALLLRNINCILTSKFNSQTFSRNANTYVYKVQKHQFLQTKYFISLSTLDLHLKEIYLAYSLCYMICFKEFSINYSPLKLLSIDVFNPEI